MKKLVFASHNLHKLEEVRSIIKGFEVVGLAEIGCMEEIIEDGLTLQDNAKIKADFVLNRFGLDCFADDTGLEVEALNGAPGVYTARFAGEGCSYRDNVDKMLRVMTGIQNRKARFRTVICLNMDGQQYFFEGCVGGEITTEIYGDAGFGYDPIFRPDGYDETFAEMASDVKNRISHRGMATRKLVDFLNGVK